MRRQRRGETIRWEIGWQDDARTDEIHTCLRANKLQLRVVLSNWFYPIMNCEGPADVRDHQRQQLIKNLSVTKNKKQKPHPKKYWRGSLNLHCLFPHWRLAGAVYQRTPELIDFQMWQAECGFPPAESPGLVYWWGLWISVFWPERKERDSRKLRDTAWQEPFPLKPAS